MNGKGDKDRTDDYRAYWENPIWEKIKEKQKERRESHLERLTKSEDSLTKASGVQSGE